MTSSASRINNVSMSSSKNRKVTFLKRVSETEEDTLVSDAILQDVVAAIYKNARIDRRYDVPYLAGSSRTGTIYIDRRMPRTLRVGSRRVEVDPFVALHEAIERAVGDRLGLTYQHAHQIALRAEEAAVRAAGISWHDYNAFMQEQMEKVEKNFSSLPPDLDLKPYFDEEDVELLRKIASMPRRRPRKK